MHLPPQLPNSGKYLVCSILRNFHIDILGGARPQPHMDYSSASYQVQAARFAKGSPQVFKKVFNLFPVNIWAHTHLNLKFLFIFIFLFKKLPGSTRSFAMISLLLLQEVIHLILPVAYIVQW